MKRFWAWVTLTIVLISSVACGGDTLAEDTPPAPTPSEGEPIRTTAKTGSYFSIDEVGLGPNGYVALTNFTDVAATLDGLYLCQGERCFALPDVVVQAGETVRVGVGDGGEQKGVVATWAVPGGLSPADGEIALSVSEDASNPGDMVLYLQWGSTPHQLTSAAVDAGLWIEGGYAPTSENAARLFKVPETGLWLFEE